jgi:glycosyltransferase involved in cell wall biosynthesis
MKFSIIIPVYNVELYLGDCLESVVKQTYSDYEVICVNDGSIDGSLKILEEFQKKYLQIKIISQPNKGLSGARNAGIHAAKGDYLFFLDSDDWIEPNTLEILAQKQNGEDLICFNGQRVLENGMIEKPDAGIDEGRLSGWEYYTKYALLPRKFHFVCAVLRLYRREYMLKNNLFFEEGIYHEDNLFTPIACYYAKSVKVIPYCLYVYRIREGSIMQTVSFQRIIDTISVANKLSDFFIPINDIDKSKLYKEIAGEYFGTFMPEINKLYGHRDDEIKKQISWNNFKEVSIYTRHKRIFLLLSIHSILFRIYLKIEKRIKQIVHQLVPDKR